MARTTDVEVLMHGQVAEVAKIAVQEDAVDKPDSALKMWIGLAAIALSVGALATFFTAQSRAAFRKEVRSHIEKTASLHGKVEALQDQLVDMRASVGAQTTRNELYLKAFILKPDLNPELASKIVWSVDKLAATYQTKADLVLAIIKVESNFDPKAVSSVGAKGLMQLMPVWAEKQAIGCDLFEVACNIEYGLRVLNFYLIEYGGDLRTALTAYNRGPLPVDSALSRGKDPGNGYADDILGTYNRLVSLRFSSVK